jgi:hypothetical protein
MVQERLPFWRAICRELDVAGDIGSEDSKDDGGDIGSEDSKDDGGEA